MEFMIGCNYWASNAGTDMWTQFDENVIEDDFKILSENGIKYLRVFPNWADFQPVVPFYTVCGLLKEYGFGGGHNQTNPYYLNENMLDRFESFCELAQKYGFQLIVGLLTGWMSGRLFIPPALYGKNLYTNPTALLFEQRFIRGFVSYFKDSKAIYAWDLGNECNCLDRAESREIASNWTSIVSNTIRAYDHTRPIVSGMHGLSPMGNWSIFDQAEHTDILTTHPYPIFVPHCHKDKHTSIRTMLHATCETLFYSDLGNKPCLVEEIGTLGPMQCSDESAAGFLKVNLFSNWAHKAGGLLWWCANEQLNLTNAPFKWKMNERELGLIDKNRLPKPALKVLKEFSDWYHSLNFELPEPLVDGICVTTQEQDQWGVAYMSYILAKQAGVNIRFAFGEQELPRADVYLLPSISAGSVISLPKYKELLKRIEDGATLYISNNNGFLSEFEQITGVRVIDSEIVNEQGSFNFKNKCIPYSRNKVFILSSIGGDVLAKDDNDNPIFTKYKYGKGVVYYLNYPLEDSLLNENYAFDSDRYEIYKEVFANQIISHRIKCNNPYIGLTIHGNYIVMINYSDEAQKLNLECDCEFDEIYYGNKIELEPFGAFVAKIKQG